jgi:hypothetical protein
MVGIRTYNCWNNRVMQASEQTHTIKSGEDIDPATKERASLAVNFARLMERVHYLEGRDKWLTDELNYLRAKLEEEFTPIPIGQVLEEAREANNKGKILEAEDGIDNLIWSVFDLDPKLQLAGGHYVLQNVIDDVIKLRHNIDRGDIAVDLEDIILSALRWCESRSRWWFNTRCWIEPVGEYLIIKRNRFAFQVKELPSQAITEI